MRTAAYLAASLALALSTAARAQEAAPEGKEAAKSGLSLTDVQAGQLGAFVAEKIDANPSAEDTEKAIRDRIEELRKPPATTTETKKDEAPAKGKKRAKKAAKEGGKRKRNAPAAGSEIKNGLTEADRVAFGKFVLQEINADHHGQALVDALKKELERVRAERAKESSPAKPKERKRKKKGDQ